MYMPEMCNILVIMFGLCIHTSSIQLPKMCTFASHLETNPPFFFFFSWMDPKLTNIQRGENEK